MRDDIRIALNYAPAALRGGMAALFALDARLGEIVANVREPQLGQIRLAWWRDALKDAGCHREHPDPVLREASRLRTEPEALAAIAEGWMILLSDPDVAELANYAAMRGDTLFSQIGVMAGVAVPPGPGAAFALCDLGWRTGDPAIRQAAAQAIGTQRIHPFPRTLRPLALLQHWARHDARLLAAGAPPPTRRQRALSALAFAFFRRAL